MCFGYANQSASLAEVGQDIPPRPFRRLTVGVPGTPLGTALGGPLVAALGARDTLLTSALVTIVLGGAATLSVASGRIRHKGSVARMWLRRVVRVRRLMV
jgi:hypothetical protein